MVVGAAADRRFTSLANWAGGSSFKVKSSRQACLVFTLSWILPIVGDALALEQNVALQAAATVRELLPRWWQWRVGLPELAVPAKDPTGRYCHIGQTGNVWFLAGFLSSGSESGEVHRRCVVPAGKRLFFPVSTFVFFPPAGADASACAREKSAATTQADAATGMYVMLDGNLLPASDIGRVATSECFSLPTGNPAPAGYPAASDGYWVLLPPLPTGRHRLDYGASYKAGSSNRSQFQRTSYELDIR